MKKLPVGISDFEELISGNYYFVDKSLLIKDILDAGAKAILLPRPRRFGKTLTMTMLRCFFEKHVPCSIAYPSKLEERRRDEEVTAASKRHLFNNLNVSKHDDIMAHQGQYPIIFMTFKDVKKEQWDNCFEKVKITIGDEFRRHRYLIDTPILDAKQKSDYQDVINRCASQSIYENSLKNLTTYLFAFYNKKPIILIDEYDAPVHAGFVNHYYKDVISFMRSFLCGGLKDNSNISFAVLTGILRVAKESIFSGLNNLQVCSLVNNAYADKFGLLEHEVQELCDYYKLSNTMDDVRTWYNGYASGDACTVYNPWSIINFAANKGKFQPYWLNTSDNALIKELIEKGSINFKLDIERLLAGNAIEKHIEESIVFDNVYSPTDAVWSFLLFCGYLSFNKIYLKEELLYGSLRLPNMEVRSFYKIVILDWLKNRINIDNYLLMLNALMRGDIQEFKTIFYDFVLKSFSTFDTSGDEPERFYHAFVLGMLVSLSETHEIKSNKESGYGRYDVMIIPKATNQRGAIIEFKKVGRAQNDSLENAANAALKQIEEKQYAAELKARGITAMVKLGIAFDGKKVLIKEA